MTTLVWAYKPLKELKQETGFVLLEDDKLAAKLLKEGAVQNPQVGALHLNHIEEAAPAKVQKDIKAAQKITKDVKAAKTKGA